MAPSNAADVLALIKEKGIKIVDFRFVDLPGIWQHFSVPTHHVDQDTFDNGLGFDGSSIRGWKGIQESDMLVFPDPTSAFVDPFLNIPTLVLICDIKDPITRQDYGRDPRFLTRKVEEYVKSTGIADTIYIGPEAEFFVLDHVEYDSDFQHAYYRVDSIEGHWNTGEDEGGNNLGHKPRYKEGYFPCPPTDTLQDIRSEMILNMEEIGIDVECHHHEVATGGQCEIDMRFDTILAMADSLMKYKYVVKNTARQHGKTATFMPKPIFMDNGSGMHTHISLWKDGQPIFAGDKYAGVSQMAIHAIGGILKHGAALVAFAAPTTNSFRRLVPGFEAPNKLCYSSRNRSAAVRIPMYSASPKSKRLEFRCPDPSCNPYLAFTALTMAALDGIQNKIDPGDPVDKDIYDLPPEESAEIPTTPATMEAALDALEADHEFLLKGDVFSRSVIDTWLEYKRTNEVDEMRLRPHPYEFSLYYDI